MMRFRKILIIFGLVILTVVIALAVVFNLMNKPSIGTVDNPKTTSSPITTGINMSPTLFSSKYASFNYPTGLVMDSKNTTYMPVVDDYNFSYKDVQAWDLAITIFSVKSGSLSDNNAYIAREINPSQYLKTTQIVKGSSVVLMSDKTLGYYNEVAFLIHGSYQATISLSGADQNGNGTLITTLDMILNSWSWKVD
jgi:hypothetical protein